jgi:hypothetical protein
VSEPLIGDEIVTGRPATAEEEMTVAVADEAAKQAVPRLNEALNRLVTLSTAMTGGALAALKNDICTGWGRVGSATFFFLALAAAVVGSLPHVSRIEWEIRALVADVESAIWRKKWGSWICCVFLAAGALVAVLGAGVRAVYPIPAGE